ncbi:MAG: hypothetical protein FWC55_10215 [Firmicutes bacterium]|nr:hypothetical protein [Bacillota bacterium]
MIFYSAVLAKNWHGIFMDTETGKTTVISNDAKALRDYYEQNKDEIWAGYGRAGLRALRAALRQSPGGARIFAYNIAPVIKKRRPGIRKPARADAAVFLRRSLAAGIEEFARGRARYVARLRMLEKYGVGPEYAGRSRAAILAAGIKKRIFKTVP